MTRRRKTLAQRAGEFWCGVGHESGGCPHCWLAGYRAAQRDARESRWAREGDSWVEFERRQKARRKRGAK